MAKDRTAKHHRTATPRHLDRHIEYRLDQELEQTFPASDAPQITCDRTPYHSRQRRRSKPPAVVESSRAPAR
jgi:hypothetical protein